MGGGDFWKELDLEWVIRDSRCLSLRDGECPKQRTPLEAEVCKVLATQSLGLKPHEKKLQYWGSQPSPLSKLPAERPCLRKPWRVAPEEQCL